MPISVRDPHELKQRYLGWDFFEGCQTAAAWVFAAGGCLEEKRVSGNTWTKRVGGLFACLPDDSKLRAFPGRV